MAIPNALNMTCDRCRVADTCPQKGSSPLTLPDKRKLLCRILGGYGREPVDSAKLSEESKKVAAQNGHCITIAEVPAFDVPSGKIYYNTVKIFSQPILHPREKLAPRIEQMYPKSYGGKNPR